MSDDDIPDGLLPDGLQGRAQIRADTEGISIRPYVIRCVDNDVTHAEAAEAELDAADAAMQEARPVQGAWQNRIERANAARAAGQAFHIQTYSVEQDSRPVRYNITSETPKDP